MPTWVAQEQRIRKRLAANVRLLREGAGLTLEDAAFLAEMSVSAWQRVEANPSSITLKTLSKLAVALGVEPADLLR